MYMYTSTKCFLTPLSKTVVLARCHDFVKRFPFITLLDIISNYSLRMTPYLSRIKPPRVLCSLTKPWKTGVQHVVNQQKTIDKRRVLLEAVVAIAMVEIEMVG